MSESRTKISHRWGPVLMMALALVVLYVFWHVLLLFILAGFFAFLVYPLVELFDRRLAHVFSIICVYLLVIIVLVTAMSLIIPTITAQSEELAKNVPTYVDRAKTLADNLQTRYVHLPARVRDITDRGLAGIEQAAVRVTQRILPAIVSFFSTFFTLLLFIPLLAFFMLLDYTGYRRMLIAVMPSTYKTTIEDLLGCTAQVLRNFIKGELTLMAVIGLADGVGLYLVGMPYAAVFGVVAGLLELIPTLGPALTTLLAVSIGLAIEPALGIKAAAVTVVVQLLENAFITPFVMSKAVGLDPVTIAFSIFLGASLAGVVGALVAIPIAMIIKIVILYFYVDEQDLPGKAKNTCKVGQYSEHPRKHKRPRTMRRAR